MMIDRRLFSPDILVLRAPLALKLRDVSDLSLVSDDLLITATETSPARRSIALRATPSGIWTAPGVPCLRPEDAINPARWSAVAQPFEIQVSDPGDRYLPMRLVARLPAEAAIAWPNFSSLPAGIRTALTPPGSPVGSTPDFVPLFPATARKPSASMAQVYSHLAMASRGVPVGNASFAVMTVSIGGSIRGVGIADSNGAVQVNFPYPLLPAASPAERAAGTTRFEWQVTIAVYCGQLAVMPNGEPPLLSTILAQLNRTPSRLLARLERLTPLPSQTLRLGQPLVLRSARAAPNPSSSLFLLPT
jgi:hypothetical protein